MADLDQAVEGRSKARPDAAPTIDRFLIYLIAAIPPIFGALSFLPVPSLLLGRIRYLSLPVILIELTAIACCAAQGQFFAAIRALPRAAKIGLVAMILLAWASALQATARPSEAIFFTFFSTVHIGFGLAMFGMFYGPWQHRRTMFIDAALIGLVAFTILLALYVATIGGRPGFNWLVLGLVGNNVRHIGFFAVIGAAMGLGRFSTVRRPRPALLALAAAVLMIAAGYWSGTRFMVAGLLGSVAIACFTVARPVWRRLTASTSAAMILAIPLSLLNQPPHPAYGIWRAFSSRVAETGGVGITNGRLGLWLRVIGKVGERPWLGHGEAQLPYLPVEPPFLEIHPHNIVLQYLFHYGIPGGILALGLLGTALSAAHRHARLRVGETLPAWMALCALAIISLVDASLYWPYPAAMTALLIGYLISASDDSGTFHSAR